MTTSISSEAWSNQTSILIRGRENRVSPKPDGQTDRQTDGQMDISIYRVVCIKEENLPQKEPLLAGWKFEKNVSNILLLIKNKNLTGI